MFYVLFREHIRLRVRVQVSLLALLDKPTMAWLASAMSSQERLECGSTFRKRNMQQFVREFHASWFITVERRDMRFVTVVIVVFEAHVHFHVAVVFNCQSGVSNVVPVMRIVYVGEATLPITRETYATW